MGRQRSRSVSARPFGLAEFARFLLAEHRRVQDVWLLREAVHRSFDTLGIMPHRRIYAAGVEPVLNGGLVKLLRCGEAR